MKSLAEFKKQIQKARTSEELLSIQREALDQDRNRYTTIDAMADDAASTLLGKPKSLSGKVTILCVKRDAELAKVQC